MTRVWVQWEETVEKEENNKIFDLENLGDRGQEQEPGEYSRRFRTKDTKSMPHTVKSVGSNYDVIVSSLTKS